MGECKGGSLGRGVSELVRERVSVSMITAVREAGMGTCENAEVGGQKPLWEMLTNNMNKKRGETLSGLGGAARVVGARVLHT